MILTELDTKRKVVFSNKFKKDYKKIEKRNLNLDLLLEIIEKLANDIPLESKHKDHQLKGNLREFRECHITPDWVLVYQKLDENKLILSLNATGSHAHALEM